MPIRISKDDTGPSGPDNYPGGGSGGGGRGPGGNIIGIIIALLFRNPKLGLLVLALAGAWYFFGGNCSGGGGGNNQLANLFSLGASFDQEKYDAVEVYEPLADNKKNPLPERVSLEQYAPPRLNQGQQGSCVGWGCGYAARSILYARSSQQNANEIAFSPAFTYNQIHLQGCQGSYIEKAMENMKDVGALPLSQFQYTDEDCSLQPDAQQIQDASQYRIKGSQRLTKSGDDYKVDMLAMKQNLAQGAPVVVGMMIGGSFMQDMMGQEVWFPTRTDYAMNGFGGHCMCVIGYDDYLEGGAFQIMNSWGPEWGKNGIGWIRYKDFDFFTKEAYGLYPMGSGKEFSPSEFEMTIGLIENETQKTIPLTPSQNDIFQTTQAISKGTKFKIETTNSIECYTYVFGQETDGSSYILFPYTPKHSPYCGITGTRLFPKDYSLLPDSIGTKDFMAVVVTKKPIDYTALNEQINKSKQSGYSDKIHEALSGQEVRNIHFTSENGMVRFSTETKGENAVVVVLEIGKK
ncbi:MAG: C1 family peptidase [Bacteroidetes bacterium]|nr:C1 family peptidase [Bacteroidota bacterium]